MTQAKPRFRSIEEYLTDGDGTDTRYELVDGVLVEMPPESDINVLISIFLTVMFSQQIPYSLIRRGTEIFVASRTVTSRYPDLMVLTEAGRAALEGATRSAVTPDMPAPALVIEVVSPGAPSEANYIRDYIEKPEEYAARGISEFWQVDPSREVVMVLRLENGAYRSRKFQGSVCVVSPTFPELALTAEQILRAGR
jgi:Uma2 family endonuclease